MAHTLTAREERTIVRALELLERTLRSPDTPVFDGVQAVRRYLRLRFARCDREEMHALYLDNAHALLAAEVVSLGTIDRCDVYPRELLRAALRHNAAAIILAHNHPSGNPAPSESDKWLTTRVRFLLASVDVRLLDHVVVTAGEIRSVDGEAVL